MRYQAIASLETYVLVSTQLPLVQVFTRRGEEWVLATFEGLEAVARLETPAVELSLKDIYRRLSFHDDGRP